MLPPRTVPSFSALRPGVTRLAWPTPPRNVFIARKDGDSAVLARAREFAQLLHASYPLNVLAEPATHAALGLPFVTPVHGEQLRRHTDLVVTMGGDGTILHAMSLFRRQRAMPPVLSFSMGTVGFLLPFDYKHAGSVFSRVYDGKALVTRRSRLSVTRLSQNFPPTPENAGTTAGHSSRRLHALNEVTIHRGGSPHLIELDVAVNGQHLTTAIADGISVSTPTGSTAYSLSAGGSIVHPGVPAMLLTPICPRSLSFRPLLIPQDAHVALRIASDARGRASVSLDGGDNGELGVGDAIEVAINADEGVWCVAEGSDTDEWVLHINRLLGFNSKFGRTE